MAQLVPRMDYPLTLEKIFTSNIETINTLKDLYNQIITSRLNRLKQTGILLSGS
ncbi:MAG: hypothetical protein IJR69_02860 [Bacteroidaceae bacterium]|nr:hypothetical protein [Bacteroidaceae bacterium]